MKNLLLLTILTLSILFASAQEPEVQEEKKKGFQKEKLFFGGNFGLTFGDYTLLNVSPQVGYRFTKFFAAGVGINVQHVSEKFRDFNNDPIQKNSLWITGLNVFGRIYPINNVFIQAQPEANYMFGKVKYYNPDQTFKLDAEIVPSLLLGGGASIPSGRGAFIIGVYYDVIQHDNSPYGDRPVYQFGFNFYLQ